MKGKDVFSPDIPVGSTDLTNFQCSVFLYKKWTALVVALSLVVLSSNCTHICLFLCCCEKYLIMCCFADCKSIVSRNPGRFEDLQDTSVCGTSLQQVHLLFFEVKKRRKILHTIMAAL